MRKIILFILFVILLKNKLISQEKNASVFISYAPTYLIIDKNQYPSNIILNQTFIKSYIIITGINYNATNRFGLEAKFGYKIDKFYFSDPTTPVPYPDYEIKRDYDYEYFTLSGGLFFKILNHLKWSLGVNANLNIDISEVKKTTMYFANGSHLSGGILSIGYENKNILAPELGVSYKYIFKNVFFIGFRPSYTIFQYKHHDTDDSQVKASFNFFLNFGYLF